MARLDFANSRIGARRARLLTDAALRDLLARGGLEARLETLRASAIGAGMPPAPGPSVPDPLAPIEASLREALHREEARLLEQAEGARPRALLSAFLALEEATAVKAIARGVAAGAPVDRTLAAAPPVPGLPPDARRAAAVAPDVAAALEVLAGAGSVVAAAARDAAGTPGEHGLLALELAADRAAFARAREACRGAGEDAAVLARDLGDRIDARNAATLLALAGAPPAADALLEGGRRLAGEALRRVAGLRDGAAVRDALAAALGLAASDLATPWGAERALERRRVGALRREARGRPLSIAVPLAYLAARRAEVRRVALVLRGAALGLPADEILDLAEEGAS